MSDPRNVDQPADPRRVVRDFLAAGQRALDGERWAEAASTLRAALELCDRIRDTDHLAIDVLERLVLALRRTAGSAEALPFQRRLVALHEAARPGDPRLVTALTALAFLCDATGRAGEAKKQLARAVALVEAGADDDPAVLAQASAIGDVLLQRVEHLDVAERLLRKAIPGLTALAGEATPAVADLTVALAEVLWRLDRDEEALPLLEAAIPTLEAEDPPRERLAVGLMHLGCARIAADRLDEAEALFLRTEALFTTFRGARSAEVVGSRYQRAIVYREAERMQEAEALFADVLKETESVLGPDSSVVADIAEHYAAVLEALGRGEEAKALRTRVEAIRGERAPS